MKAKNINVTIANVIAWFEESEQCMLHSHAERIPNSLEQQATQGDIEDAWWQAIR